MAYTRDGPVLRPAGDCFDGCSIGKAVNRALAPHAGRRRGRTGGLKAPGNEGPSGGNGGRFVEGLLYLATSAATLKW